MGIDVHGIVRTHLLGGVNELAHHLVAVWTYGILGADGDLPLGAAQALAHAAHVHGNGLRHPRRNGTCAAVADFLVHRHMDVGSPGQGDVVVGKIFGKAQQNAHAELIVQKAALEITGRRAPGTGVEAHKVPHLNAQLPGVLGGRDVLVRHNFHGVIAALGRAVLPVDMNGSESIAEGIVNSGKVKDFQEFLKENNIDYELYGCEVDGRKAIYCHFDNKDADFFKIASTGTRSLALFYYWYIRMEKASFVFIDEFDAFYHYELSESVQKRLRRISDVQVFTTTHNTDLMSNDLLRPDCYFLLENNSINAISELTEKELRQAHNLQKMYKAGAFNGR